MKPIIGINLDVHAGSLEQLRLNATYSKVVQASGGIPLLIAPMPDEDLLELLGRLSGVLFTGGKDYNPKLYGSEPHEKVELAHTTRQEFDIRLMRLCLMETHLPILGICAGHQLLNIALGGTLLQHLDDREDVETEILHFGSDVQACEFSRHQVRLEESSHLKNIFKCDQLDVPSAHHQAVDDLGQGFKVTSRADDGVIESIELPERGFTIGVQWHPERDYKVNSPLFSAFLGVAAGCY